MPRTALPILLLIALCAACKPPAPGVRRPPAASPKIRATVVTIRTTIQPANRVSHHTLVIAGDRARSTNEYDVWRIFDMKAHTVTYVDDIDRTVRTEPIADSVRRRRSMMNETLPSHYPNARLTRTDRTRSLVGVTAHEAVIEAGAYRRELWFAEHPAIPSGLFAAMHATDPPSTPLAPMMRSVDAALLAMNGFPLLDRAEIPAAKSTITIERAVLDITTREVSASVVALPRGYRDVSVRPAH